MMRSKIENLYGTWHLLYLLQQRVSWLPLSLSKEREEEERLQQQISQRRAEADAKRRRLEQSEALLRDQYNKLKADLNAIEARKAYLTKEANVCYLKLVKIK